MGAVPRRSAGGGGRSARSSARSGPARLGPGRERDPDADRARRRRDRRGRYRGDLAPAPSQRARRPVRRCRGRLRDRRPVQRRRGARVGGRRHRRGARRRDSVRHRGVVGLARDGTGCRAGRRPTPTPSAARLHVRHDRSRARGGGALDAVLAGHRRRLRRRGHRRIGLPAGPASRRGAAATQRAADLIAAPARRPAGRGARSLRRRGGAPADRAAPGDLVGDGADAPSATARTSRGRAGEIRRVEPAAGESDRLRLPAGHQARDDRVVRTDLHRVLRRQRDRHAVPHRPRPSG